MRREAKLAIVLGAVFTVTLLAMPRLLPHGLALYRSDICFRVPVGERVVFLTIDDAPSRRTAEILRVLKKHDVPATFFITADRVNSLDELAEIAGAGHALGNHLKTTRACSTLSPAEFQSDLAACAELLERYEGAKLFRPPSDFTTPEQREVLQRHGYRTAIGTVFPLDHWISEPDWLVRIARWLSVPGGIVILHDGDPRGATTAVVLDRLIPALKASGYAFDRLETNLPVRTARFTRQ